MLIGYLLGFQIFCVGKPMWFVGRLGPPQIFSKIKLVQNRAILDTSGELSLHNKRIDCPFCDELSFE